MNPVYLDAARLLTQVAPLVFVADTFALNLGPHVVFIVEAVSLAFRDGAPAEGSAVERYRPGRPTGR